MAGVRRRTSSCMTEILLVPTAFGIALDYIEHVMGRAGHGEMLKRRDPREPLRRQKEQAEERLARLLSRYWRRQAQRIREQLVRAGVPVKANRSLDWMLAQFGDEFWTVDDEEFMAALFETLGTGAREAAGAAAAGIKPSIDPAITNREAAAWARTYTGNWMSALNETSRAALKEAIAAFVETPGMTIGDVMRELGPIFGEDRALSAAVTEVTRAYARGNQIVGEALAKEFPDVPVIKIWYTNNDERVCPICEPLDGKEVGIDEPFPADVEGDLLLPPAHTRCRCWTETTTKIT